MTTQFQSGCKYRRDEWLIEVFYDEDGRFVAENPRTGGIVPVTTLPVDGWIKTDSTWTKTATPAAPAVIAQMRSNPLGLVALALLAPRRPAAASDRAAK